MRVRRGWVVAVAAVLVPLLFVVGVLRFGRARAHQEEYVVHAKPEAPPDLEKLRPAFTAGLDAIQRRDGAEAVKQLSSFHFGKRAVDEYRVYYLANAYQLAKDSARARATLADLLSHHPAFVHLADAGLNLGGLYAAIADWRHAADAYAGVAANAGDSNVAAGARWSAVDARFARGDIAGVLYDARTIAIKNPRSDQAIHAIELTRAITGDQARLTAAERLERAVSFLRDGDAQNAFDELALLEANGVPADLRVPMQLNRGLALNQLRRFEDSNKVLEPLAKGPYRFAIPAIFTASKNYAVLSASINPNVTKTIVVRQQVGTVKVRAKGKKKATTKPKFANVKKNVQLVDLAKKSKKDEYDRLATERLKDLLSLQLADEVRIEVLNSLIERAEAKNQDAYERQLIVQLAKIDPAQDAGLQHFWDKAWAAYARGDLNGARELLAFIRDNYRNPNTKRQSMYWFARSGERLGRKDESAAIYHALASAPFDDIYAIESEKRGAKRQPTTVNPLSNRMDWRDIAERNMPKELRLGYELTALSDFADAKLEIDKNRNRKNQQYADALMADLYHASGNMLDTLKTLRLAFPELATVEQDSVPPYFLKMYYPLKYADWIRKYSEGNGVDRFTVMGLIHQESYFNAKAKSAVGATGLMQLMPATGRELAGRFHIAPRLDNPETNIRLGTAHFKMLVNLFNGSNELAIASYNAGQGRVLQWRRAAPGKPMDEFIEAIPFRETRTYVKHVVMLASTYRRMYP
ncbi:MAG: soluble lytic murein transglycosylase [Thermoanaerobaculia bacterium]|nr:soluble lytic murein transglycosylase [Thermoanaerobaculia bacterium]